MVLTMNYSNRAKKHCAELLTTPSTIFSHLIADLQRARQSIDMEFYIFASDRIGQTIAELLCRKSRQGVRVRLIVDGMGSLWGTSKVFRSLRDNGVDLQRYTHIGHCRNHRKMVIIDGRVAFIGGINIADRYVVGNRLGVWHDVELRFTGGCVHSLASLFDYDYALAKGVAAQPPAPEAYGDMRLSFTELGGGGAMMRLMEDVVEDAEHSLTLLTPYFMPPKRLLDRLSAAVLRGVEVTVITPERCDIWALNELARHYMRRAQTRGINIIVVRGAFLHAKLAMVDDRRTVLGSANIDSRSLAINRELMLSICRHEVCRRAEEFILRLRKMGSRPHAEELRSAIPSFVTKVLEPVL